MLVTHPMKHAQFENGSNSFSCLRTPDGAVHVGAACDDGQQQHVCPAVQNVGGQWSSDIDSPQGWDWDVTRRPVRVEWESSADFPPAGWPLNRAVAPPAVLAWTTPAFSSWFHVCLRLIRSKCEELHGVRQAAGASGGCSRPGKKAGESCTESRSSMNVTGRCQHFVSSTCPSPQHILLQLLLIVYHLDSLYML